MSRMHRELERYLHTHIPLSRAMAMSVKAVDDEGVRLSAPYAPNVNHRGTVFGGSIAALAILSAWTLVHVRLRAAGLPCTIVIQRNALEYLRPIEGEFEAFCPAPPEEDWARFLETLERRSRARIILRARLHSGTETVGTFQGAFVAILSPEAGR
jgi:thioesterase domain-containing protein